MRIALLSFLLLLQVAPIFAQNKAVFSVQADKPGAAVSSTMWGIFFEDINLGADGGMYAELIKNRSFEFFKQKDLIYQIYQEQMLSVRW